VRRPCTAVSLAAGALLVGATGCGDSRVPAPRVAPPAPPAGKRTVDPGYGVTFVRPANWAAGTSAPPQLATVASGQAFVVVWRYARQETLPATPAALDRARRALIAASRARDPSLRVTSSRTVTVGGAPGVELLADERIGTARREVRSTHLYAYGAELVLDAYAPPAEFPRVDRTVFVPLLTSLRVRQPQPG
jgi:hypothetical protein